MTPEEIAYKYVHGKHDALTDNQEKKDMVADIEACIKTELKKAADRAEKEIVENALNLRSHSTFEVATALSRIKQSIILTPLD